VRAAAGLAAVVTDESGRLADAACSLVRQQLAAWSVLSTAGASPACFLLNRVEHIARHGSAQSQSYTRHVTCRPTCSVAQSSRTLQCLGQGFMVHSWSSVSWRLHNTGRAAETLWNLVSPTRRAGNSIGNVAVHVSCRRVTQESNSWQVVYLLADSRQLCFEYVLDVSV
jgi:hypothetical protein